MREDVIFEIAGSPTTRASRMSLEGFRPISHPPRCGGSGWTPKGWSGLALPLCRPPAPDPPPSSSAGICSLPGERIPARPSSSGSRPAVERSKGLEPPPHFKEAKSLGTQGDALYLAGHDTNGARRLWRRKNGAWLPASNPPEELLALSPIPIGQSHLLYPTASRTTPVLAYHTITDTWSPLPAAEGETVAMVPRKNRVMRVVKGAGRRTCAARRDRRASQARAYVPRLRHARGIFRTEPWDRFSVREAKDQFRRFLPRQRPDSVVGAGDQLHGDRR